MEVIAPVLVTLDMLYYYNVITILLHLLLSLLLLQGDSISVYPENPQWAVDKWMKVMGLTGNDLIQLDGGGRGRRATGWS